MALPSAACGSRDFFHEVAIVDRRFLLIPAIDLMNGQCVRLKRGKAEEKTVYSDNPAEMARSFEMCGAKRIHIVDLDGAFEGKPRNLEAIQAIRRRVGVVLEVGGGIRDESQLDKLLKIGVDYAILGTQAAEDPKFLETALRKHGERIVVGLDAKDGKIATRGWTRVANLDALAWAKELERAGVRTLIYTDIATDGTLQGPNLAAQREMAQAVGMDVIASGGIGSLGDVHALAGLGAPNLIGAIAGKAIYDGKIDLKAAIESLSALPG